jgi:hypothetical protein
LTFDEPFSSVNAIWTSLTAKPIFPVDPNGSAPQLFTANQAGEVAGTSSYTAPSGTNYAETFSPPAYTPMHLQDPGSSYGYGYGINASGAVLGTTALPTTVPTVVWLPNAAPVYLSSLLPSGATTWNVDSLSTLRQKQIYSPPVVLFDDYSAVLGVQNMAATEYAEIYIPTTKHP